MKVNIGLSSIQRLFIVANKWHYLSMRMFIRISCPHAPGNYTSMSPSLLRPLQS
jgi:hypothetical protein